MGALCWNTRRLHGELWEEPFRKKFGTALPSTELMFLMGTIHRFPDQWLIVRDRRSRCLERPDDAIWVPLKSTGDRYLYAGLGTTLSVGANPRPARRTPFVGPCRSVRRSRRQQWVEVPGRV